VDAHAGRILYLFSRRRLSQETKYSILVVDDEPAIREVFSRFLERRGHAVITCGTAGEGITTAGAQTFDVVVTDLVLPDMTGLDLASSLRDICPRSKVILLTGEPSDETARRADELGVYKYLAKPIRAAALIEVVEEAASA